MKGKNAERWKKESENETYWYTVWAIHMPSHNTNNILVPGLDKYNGFACMFVHANFHVHKAVTVDTYLHCLIYNMLIDIVFPMAVFKL